MVIMELRRPDRGILEGEDAQVLTLSHAQIKPSTIPPPLSSPEEE